MARGESPYQGRYTVPTVDFSAIERGGAAWGQAAEKVGGAIASGIKDLKLKKEEKKVTDASLKASLQALPMWVKNNVITEDQATLMEAELLDPNTTSAQKKAFMDEAERNIVTVPQIVNTQLRTQLMDADARTAQVQARFNEAGEDDAIVRLGYAQDHATYLHEKMETIKGLENKNKFFENEMNAKIAQFGWAEDKAKEFRDTATQRRDILDAQAGIAKGEAKLWELYTPEERTTYTKASQDVILKLRNRQVTAADFDIVQKLAPKDIAEEMKYYTGLQADLEAQKFNFKGKRYDIETYRALQREHDPDGVGEYPNNGIPERISGMLTYIEGRVDQVLKRQPVQAITTPPGATDTSRVSGRRPISELRIEEVPSVITKLEASKAALDEEKKGLRTPGLTRPIPKFSTWGMKMGDEEKPVTLGWITKRESEIQEEITAIESQIEKLKALTPSEAPQMSDMFETPNP